jgi:alginate production protein
LELAPRLSERTDRIDTQIYYAEYRGIEDVKLAGFAIFRTDHDGLEGSPRLFGGRVLGAPTAELSYWTEIAVLGGRDELGRHFRGRAYDTGFTYRFNALPLHPNLTVGYAFGSGDGNPTGTTNHQFRPSGLQSDERKFAGVTQFKVYGEALDPFLSNIKIFTLGFGFRPTPNSSLDLVYHSYQLDKLAEQAHHSQITAEMNQVDSRLSKDIGSGLDIVLGFRNLFGLRRLGLDLRGGVFFPGKAFLRNEGSDVNPIIRRADKAVAVVGKIWW